MEQLVVVEERLAMSQDDARVDRNEQHGIAAEDKGGAVEHGCRMRHAQHGDIAVEKMDGQSADGEKGRSQQHACRAGKGRRLEKEEEKRLEAGARLVLATVIIVIGIGDAMHAVPRLICEAVDGAAVELEHRLGIEGRW